MGTDIMPVQTGPIAQQCEVIPQGVFDPDFGPIIGSIPEGTYDLWAQVYVTPGCGDASVKMFLEIYEKGLGEEIIMYETSFEDNFDIYNNWVQIDADCGLTGGQYDSWSWSDARANCGEHSMKSTMYDIYKGNQEDYLESTQCFDISDQYAVNVSFDIYVDGSGLDSTGYFVDWALMAYRTAYMYVPYDFLDFEVLVGQDWINPSNWETFVAQNYPPFLPSNVGDELAFVTYPYGFIDFGDEYPGSYVFFDTINLPIYSMPTGPQPPYYDFQDYSYEARDLGNGWWHVWYTIPTATYAQYGGDPECFNFRFSWKSDPEVQYEGAYVDCIKVVSIEDVETKVWQGHTQGPVTLVDGVNYVDLPLDWEAINHFTCNDKTTIYDFKLWAEVLDGTHFTIYELPDNWIPIVVEVGNYYDAAVDTVTVTDSFTGDPIGATVDEGTDLTIDATVHLYGTVPTTNVPVTFTAQKKVWDTAWSTDFESGAIGWQYVSYGDLDSLWHVTTFDAYESTKSMGCFDEDTKYYLNDMYYDVALNSANVNVEGALEAWMDYNCKWITEDNAAGGDRWGTVFLDNSVNSYLSHSTATYVGMNTYGFHPDWMGPDQTRGYYVGFDILKAYNYWHDIRGAFTNPDSSQSYDLSVGFVFYISDLDGCVNPIAEANGIHWSGVYIDNVEVKTLKADETVYSQTVIIPEMEPCVDYDVQFEWENVPYCNYLLSVDVNPAGACNNYNFEPWTTQILVTSDKEAMNNPETIDYTQFGAGEWVISSSDTDNYIATQSGEVYGADADQLMYLCLEDYACGDEPGCIDISNQLADGMPVLLDFTVWFEHEGFPYDYCDILMSFEPNCPADQTTDWIWIDSLDVYNWASYADACADADGFVTYSCLAGAPLDIGALCTLYGSDCFQLAFHFVSDSGLNMRGVKFTEISITNLLYDEFPTMVYSDFVDECNNLDNWCQAKMTTGSYWFEDPLNNGLWMNFFDEDADFAKDALESTVPQMNDALIWTVDIGDTVMAWLAFSTDYQFEKVGLDPQYWDHGYVEISLAGANDWTVLRDYTGTKLWFNELIQLPDKFIGQEVQIRFRVVTDADTPVACDHWFIDGVIITGKQDHLSPISTATMTGTQKESGWYTTPVKITITAEDQGIAGMGTIHYKLDGVETVVDGNKATVTVSGNGDHTFEYWACDKVGNCEPHHVLPAFKIDSGAKPTVSISAPTPGIYFMGNKILSSSNTIIIGSFTAEATASDADSGIYRVSFYLDDEFIGDDTTAPFSMLICKKHMGAGTLKVVAEDFAQNTAEASMSLKYFKFF
jgi:hypothetical protein